MGKMVDYIKNPVHAIPLANLLLLEANRNLEEVQSRQQWSQDERDKCMCAIVNEQKRINEAQFNTLKNSVKGESAIKNCYSVGGVSAPDVISLRVNNNLQLIEVKYAQKVGGTGILSTKIFRERIAEKFLKATEVMEDEDVVPLRVVVVVEEQLPLFISRARLLALRQAGIVESEFSSDKRKYKYCICSSKRLQFVIDNVSVNDMGCAEVLVCEL